MNITSLIICLSNALNSQVYFFSLCGFESIFICKLSSHNCYELKLGVFTTFILFSWHYNCNKMLINRRKDFQSICKLHCRYAHFYEESVWHLVVDRRKGVFRDLNLACKFLDIVNKFSLCSGLKLIRDKTKALGLGKEKKPQLLVFYGQKKQTTRTLYWT